jgi:hypothetical protein
MAADHYKEKFKECQRLQKQINKLSDQSVSIIAFLHIFLFVNKIYNILNINLLGIIYLLSLGY